MAVLDHVARISTVALLGLLAIVLARDMPRSAATWTAAGFFASIGSYLWLSSPEYVPLWGLEQALQALALAAPAAFWFFSRALFQDEETYSVRHGTLLVALVGVGFARPSARVAEFAYYAGSLGLVGVALSQVVRGLPGDLIEPRRRLRAAFTVVVGIEIVTVLGAELALGDEQAPRMLELVKSLAALAVTVLFGAWLIAPRRDLLIDSQAVPAGPDPVGAATLEAEDDRLRARLLSVMTKDQLFKQEGLTIGALAEVIKMPEYRVRRIINRDLGHRNFNAFLNDLRTTEACRLLADPAHERVPIFNLALDLGYGSLGPFNRAFKAKTGQTPTEYRRAHRVSQILDHESPAES